MSAPELRELPSKLYFRIGEVAGLVGVEPHVLRYWEREFRSIRPTKSAKGQRVYSRKDVENLLRVRDLLYRDGFTIAGAKKKLQRTGAPVDEEPIASTQSEASGAPVAMQAADAEPTAHVAPVAQRAVAASAPRAAAEIALPPTARATLEALRADVTAFLDELSEDEA